MRRGRLDIVADLSAGRRARRKMVAEATPSIGLLSVSGTEGLVTISRFDSVDCCERLSLVSVMWGV